MEGVAWLRDVERSRAATIWRISWGILALGMVVAIAFFLPAAPVNSGWWRISGTLQETYAGGIGWPELVEEVARMRDSLAPE